MVIPLDVLETRIWYRFFKLCYVVAYIISLSLVLFLAYGRLPHDYTSTYTISCHTGKNYSSSDLRSYAKNLPAKEVSDGILLATVIDLGFLDDKNDANARKLCAFGIRAVIHPYIYEDLFETPLEKNYSLDAVHSTRGSYKEAGKILAWSLGIVILGGEVVRRSFLYVVAGRPFFSGPGFFSRRRKAMNPRT